MLFKWELIEKIVRGEKIQTRRPVKSGEVLRQMESPHGGYTPIGVVQNGRMKIAINKDYAVQYGRGKPTVWWQMRRRGELPVEHDVMPYEFYKKMVDKHGDAAVGFLYHYEYKPLRILITDIRREDVRDISHDDAIDGGFTFAPKYSFLMTWCGFYDASMSAKLLETEYDPNSPSHCPLYLRDRPDKLYQAWAYTFEVVR